MGSMCTRHMRRLLCFMTLVVMAFMLCSASISVLYDSSSHSSAVSDLSGSFAGRRESVQSTENQFFLSVLSAQSVFREIKPTQGAAGRIQHRQILLQIATGAQMLSLPGFLLLVCYFAHVAGKNNKRRSVIAFLIGGHAPPSPQAG